MNLAVTLILIVLAVLLLGISLYVFANMKNIVTKTSKVSNSNAQNIENQENN